MSQQRERLVSFIRLVEQSKTVEAMEQFYSADVVIFENRELARAGLEPCIKYEREMLAKLVAPPKMKALRFAYDEATDTAFIEWLIRFQAQEGRPMRLEEVVVQTWHGGKIAEERFYYEGFVDEGD
jgi:ketosteroid isomerase-like protein